MSKTQHYSLNLDLADWIICNLLLGIVILIVLLEEIDYLFLLYLPKLTDNSIYIDDVLNAIFFIIKKKPYISETFNISSKTKINVKSLIRLLQKNFKTEKSIMFGKKTPGDIFGFGGDNDKFKKKYKWKPIFSINEGIKKLSDHYQI